MEKINLQQQFARFSVHWNPKMVGELNSFAVKIVVESERTVLHVERS